MSASEAADYLAWSPVYVGINLVFSGIIYCPSLVILCAITALLPPRTLATFSRRAGSLFFFVAILTFIGACFSLLWGGLIWGWLYRSTDYCGAEFFPFVPINQGAIDMPFGDEPHWIHSGMTLFQLQEVWFLFAAATWGFTFLLHRLLLRWLRDLRSPFEPRRVEVP